MNCNCCCICSMDFSEQPSRQASTDSADGITSPGDSCSSSCAEGAAEGGEGAPLGGEAAAVSSSSFSDGVEGGDATELPKDAAQPAAAGVRMANGLGSSSLVLEMISVLMKFNCKHAFLSCLPCLRLSKSIFRC